MEAGSQCWQEVSGRTHGGEKAIRAPCPVTDDWINEARDCQRIEKVADKAGAANHGAGGNGGASVGKCELKNPHCQEGNAGAFIRRRRVLEEEPVIADEAVSMTEHESESNRVEENAAQTC